MPWIAFAPARARSVQTVVTEKATRPSVLGTSTTTYEPGVKMGVSFAAHLSWFRAYDGGREG
jgi:hypothetical protein